MASSLYKSKLKPFYTKLTHTHLHLRHFSPSILNPDSTKPLSAKDKSKAALSLIKFEKNPETILEICRAAALTPDSHLDRIIFSKAISKLSESNYYEGIREFLNELQARLDLKTERFVSHCMVLYGEAGLLGDAVKVFDKMSELGIRRTTKSLNALLFLCIFANDYGKMKRVFVEFPKRYGIEADVDTYNTVIKGFCESGSSSSVYSVLTEMDRKRCKPNTSTFGLWIAGFYKEEKFDDVGKALEELRVKPLSASSASKRMLVPALNMRLWYAPQLELPDGSVLKGATLVAIRPSEQTVVKKEVADGSWVCSAFEEPYQTAAKMLIIMLVSCSPNLKLENEDLKLENERIIPDDVFINLPLFGSLRWKSLSSFKWK